jgi:hypothetical protein
MENHLQESGPLTDMVGNSLFHGGMEQTGLTGYVASGSEPCLLPLQHPSEPLTNIDLPEHSILSSFVDFDWVCSLYFTFQDSLTAYSQSGTHFIIMPWMVHSKTYNLLDIIEIP